MRLNICSRCIQLFNQNKLYTAQKKWYHIYINYRKWKNFVYRLNDRIQFHRWYPAKEFNIEIGKIVTPKNIALLLRIYNNQLSIFLSSKYILDNLMHLDIHFFILINNQELQLRKFNNPAKKIVVSNICSLIYNQSIPDQLTI